MKIKNIAIIAHVDHGKTTLVDQLLKSSGLFRENEKIEERMMDSNDLEKERGITILAKTTAVQWGDYKINILDTPGHADFSGEVERILSMVDGVLVLVDAYEGVMPQTKFVLKKALEKNLRPIIVVNKVDKPEKRINDVLDEVFELLVELGASDEILDYPVVYASAINGQSGLGPNKLVQNMDAIYEKILEFVPDPNKRKDNYLAIQISMLDYNDYLGRIGIGRIYGGKISVGQNVESKNINGDIVKFKISKLFGFSGLDRIEIDSAETGQIIALAGNTNISVSDIIYEEGKEINDIEPLKIDEPTLNMQFVTNDSPFVGKEGKNITSSKIEERLNLEAEIDVSLRVSKTDSPNIFNVSGRGELHLSILVENLRREGFELQVGKPHVKKKEINGVVFEPVEEITIDCPEEYSGSIIESLGNRKAEFKDMRNIGSSVRMKFECFSRTLIGYNGEFMTLTKGLGIYNHTFLEYRKSQHNEFKGRNQGVLIANSSGSASAYSLIGLEDRGIMLIEPGQDVYEGMIVGINNKQGDITVNVVKAKAQTNVRSSNKDNTVVIKKPKILSLEESIQLLADDEYCEVTPKNIRLRKKFLNESERKRNERKKLF
ncbi:MAG: translational GTPase TypA [Mycoplasmataceae bacterium]|nr:translational GTPase TypA [Mycoplasmataceae bacterium]